MKNIFCRQPLHSYDKALLMIIMMMIFFSLGRHHHDDLVIYIPFLFSLKLLDKGMIVSMTFNSDRIFEHWSKSSK